MPIQDDHPRAIRIGHPTGWQLALSELGTFTGADTIREDMLYSCNVPERVELAGALAGVGNAGGFDYIKGYFKPGISSVRGVVAVDVYFMDVMSVPPTQAPENSLVPLARDPASSVSLRTLGQFPKAIEKGASGVLLRTIASELRDKATEPHAEVEGKCAHKYYRP